VNDPAAAALRLSVIVPAWNEGDNLRRLVPQLLGLEGVHEVVVVDALPDPKVAEVVRQAGGVYLHATAPNRGAQMNLGAENAAGEILLFHHADSVLKSEHVTAIQRALCDPGVIGGAFYRKFDTRHPWLSGLEIVARFFTRHGGSFFGDQSIFVRHMTFSALGGFAPIPLMEDVEFSRRLRRAGKVAVLNPSIESSSRRHLERGPWRTSLQNGLFIALYKCGLSPKQLHRWYYRERLSPHNDQESRRIDSKDSEVVRAL
jgi:hypothetical protein